MSVYENNQLVFATLIASGVDPYFTRPGLFQIYDKKPTETMSGAFAADLSDYYYLEQCPGQCTSMKHAPSTAPTGAPGWVTHNHMAASTCPSQIRAGCTMGRRWAIGSMSGILRRNPHRPGCLYTGWRIAPHGSSLTAVLANAIVPGSRLSLSCRIDNRACVSLRTT